MDNRSRSFILFGRSINDEYDDDEGEEKIIPISSIKYLTRDNTYFDKHSDKAYDEKGFRRIKTYDIILYTKTGYSYKESYKTSEERDIRWNEISTI